MNDDLLKKRDKKNEKRRFMDQTKPNFFSQTKNKKETKPLSSTRERTAESASSPHSRIGWGRSRRAVHTQLKEHTVRGKRKRCEEKEKSGPVNKRRKIKGEKKKKKKRAKNPNLT